MKRIADITSAKGAKLYARRLATGAYTAPKGKKTPKRKARLIKWPGMPAVRVLMKREKA